MTNKTKVIIAVACVVVTAFAFYGIYKLIYGTNSSTGNEALVIETIDEMRQLVVESKEAVETIKKEVKTNVRAIGTSVQKTVASYSVDSVAHEFNSMLADYRAGK